MPKARRLLPDGLRAGLILRPLSIIVVIAVLKPFVVLELYLAGRFALVVDLAATLVVYLAVVWLFWLLVLASSTDLLMTESSRQSLKSPPSIP